MSTFVDLRFVLHAYGTLGLVPLSGSQCLRKPTMAIHVHVHIELRVQFYVHVWIRIHVQVQFCIHVWVRVHVHVHVHENYVFPAARHIAHV